METQPTLSVTVNVYVVLTVAEEIGFGQFVHDNPTAGDHEYVKVPLPVPAIKPPILTFCSAHFVVSGPASAEH